MEYMIFHGPGTDHPPVRYRPNMISAISSITFSLLPLVYCFGAPLIDEFVTSGLSLAGVQMSWLGPHDGSCKIGCGICVTLSTFSIYILQFSDNRSSDYLHDLEDIMARFSRCVNKLVPSEVHLLYQTSRLISMCIKF